MAAVLIIIVVAVIVCAAKLIPGLDPARAEESGGGLIQYLSEYATYSNSVLFLNRRSKSLRAVMRVRPFKSYREDPAGRHDGETERAFLLFDEKNISRIKLADSVRREAEGSRIGRFMTDAGEIYLVTSWNAGGAADSSLATYEKCAEILDWVCCLESEESH